MIETSFQPTEGTAPHVPEGTDLIEWYYERGYSDGFPIAPPTPQKIAGVIDALGGNSDRLLCRVPPRWGSLTREVLAINMVMAGCRPEYAPVVEAAMLALCAPPFNLNGVQATTHMASPLLVVNGPIRKTIGMNAGCNVFGSGNRANATIGRALRLMLLNVGGGWPGLLDKSTLGHPGKYTYCIAENESVSPWPSLARQRGFEPDVSTVTVIGGEAPHNINEHEATTANGLLTTICGTMAETGQNTLYYNGEPLLILGPEHAATIARDGFSKEDVQRAVYDDARIPITRFGRETIERRLHRRMAHRYKHRNVSPDTLVTVAQRWEDVMVIVAGGAGKHSMFVPTFGATRSVTRAILKADGSPWRPADFVPE
jgi:hypothetical protein